MPASKHDGDNNEFGQGGERPGEGIVLLFRKSRISCRNHAFSRNKLTSGMPKLNPTVPYADTSSKTKAANEPQYQHAKSGTKEITHGRRRC